MKDRIKRFVSEHKSECAVAVGSVLMTLMVVQRVKEARSNERADIWTGVDGSSLITVSKRGGKAVTYFKPASQVS